MDEQSKSMWISFSFKVIKKKNVHHNKINKTHTYIYVEATIQQEWGKRGGMVVRRIEMNV